MTKSIQAAMGHPVNKQAALVTSKTEEYVPNKKIVNIESAYPLPTRPIRRMEAENKQFPKLFGRKFGTLEVIGIYFQSRSSGGTRWVCRCVCGRYTVRLSKAIQNPKNSMDCCELCRHGNFLKKSVFKK